MAADSKTRAQQRADRIEFFRGHKPRFKVELACGRRLEPWIRSARPLVLE